MNPQARERVRQLMRERGLDLAAAAKAYKEETAAPVGIAAPGGPSVDPSAPPPGIAAAPQQPKSQTPFVRHNPETGEFSWVLQEGGASPGATTGDRALGSFQQPENILERMKLQYPGVELASGPEGLMVGGKPYDPDDVGEATHEGLGQLLGQAFSNPDLVGDIADETKNIGIGAITAGAMANPTLQGMGLLGRLALEPGVAAMTTKAAQLFGDVIPGGNAQSEEERTDEQLLAALMSPVSTVAGEALPFLTRNATAPGRLAGRVGREKNVLSNLAESEEALAGMPEGAELNPVQQTNSFRLKNWAESIDDSNIKQDLTTADARSSTANTKAIKTAVDDFGVDRSGAEAAVGADDAKVATLKKLRADAANPLFEEMRTKYADITVEVPALEKAAQKENSGLAKLIEEQGQLGLDDIQSTLEELGYKVSKGDTSAKFQMRALLTDLDNAAKTMSAAGDPNVAGGAKLLQKARDVYREHSGPLNEWDSTEAIKKIRSLAGEDREGDYASWLHSTKNSESLRKLVDEISTTDAGAVQAMGADALSELVIKATDADGNISAAALRKSLKAGRGGHNLEILFSNNKWGSKAIDALDDFLAKAENNTTGDLLAKTGNPTKRETPSLSQMVVGGTKRLVSDEQLPLWSQKALGEVLSDPKKAKKFLKLLKTQGKVSRPLGQLANILGKLTSKSAAEEGLDLDIGTGMDNQSWAKFLEGVKAQPQP